MPDNQSPNQPSPRTTIIWTVLMAALFLFLFTQLSGINRSGEETATDTLMTSEFIAAVDEGRVSEATMDAASNTVTGKYYPARSLGGPAIDAFNTAFSALNTGMSGARSAGEDAAALTGSIATSAIDTNGQLGGERNYTTTWVGQDSLGELMAAHPNVKYDVTLPNGMLSSLLSYLPMIIFAGFFIFLFWQMSKANNSQMSFGKTKAKMATEERPDVHFSDVAGCDEAVEEMQEIRDFLANPSKYQEIGAKIPRGCLLVGPPGTGKTLLARAVAGEAGVPFFSISGSDFVEMFVGVGASRVRDLFKQAKEASPAIIFIDEIDAVGRQRGTGLGGGHDEREQTLNQLLVEMDGFDANDSVVLIAATNRSDVLDPALLRPGRFDRQIVVDVPDVKGREKILKVHAQNKPIAQDVDLDKIAKLTPGFTGADLANLLNESALLTARRSKKVISMQEVTESMERVIAGPERKGRVMDDATKNTIAYHESGHALVGHTLPLADPVHKISIVSRGRALGYTLSIPKEDKVLNSRNEMMQELAVFMGGRVAEEIFCDDITTGASNDLERATKMARQMVTQYGMSTELGTQIFGQPNHEVFLGRDYGNTQDYSEETAKRIDDEVARIMKQAHDTAYEILSSHKDQMDLMANVLLERETIDGDACKALLDNRWNEYLAYEQSEEGKRATQKAATTVVGTPDAKARPRIARQGQHAAEGRGPAQTMRPGATGTTAGQRPQGGQARPQGSTRPTSQGAPRAGQPSQQGRPRNAGQTGSARPSRPEGAAPRRPVAPKSPEGGTDYTNRRSSDQTGRVDDRRPRNNEGDDRRE